jgi:glycosyltransferase involved in cell wall biosynthesis
MKIEGVIVCYNYSDFLEYTIADNLQHLDRLVVVTHPSDKATSRLCDKYGVDCLKTEIFHDDNDKFNKGRAINLALSHLRHDDWILHIDADILLPHRFRHMLKMAKLNKENIYGCDRLNTVTYANWMQNKNKTVPQHQWRYMVTPQPEFPVGSRLIHMEYGYCPIGYFQLWHSSKHRQYPIICGNAEHSDVLHAVQWSRENRILLPEFFCYHLESEYSEMGTNWEGRKTKTFGPVKEPIAPMFSYENGLKPPKKP